MIKWKWIKSPDKTEFSSYEDIMLDEYDIKYINKVPANVMSKLYSITEAELSKKLLDWKLSIEQVQWALEYAKYLKTYFNK